MNFIARFNTVQYGNLACMVTWEQVNVASMCGFQGFQHLPFDAETCKLNINCNIVEQLVNVVEPIIQIIYFNTHTQFHCK